MDKELIEIKSGNWGIADRSSSDYTKLKKQRDLIYGKPPIIDEHNKRIDLSGKYLFCK